MTHFKTKKANLLFVVLPKDAMSVCIDDNDICFIQKCITKYIGINKGYTLLGKLSEVSEEVAKGLVDDDEIYEYYFSGFEKWIDIYKDYNNSEPMPYGVVFTATESLTSIATHLGMELTDNIYLLNKI